MFRRLILAAVFSCSLFSTQNLYAGAAASAPDGYGGSPTPSPTPSSDSDDGRGAESNGVSNSGSNVSNPPSSGSDDGRGAESNGVSNSGSNVSGPGNGGDDDGRGAESNGVSNSGDNDDEPASYNNNNSYYGGAGPGPYADPLNVPASNITQIPQHYIEAMKQAVTAVNQMINTQVANGIPREFLGPGSNMYNQAYNRAYYQSLSAYAETHVIDPKVGMPVPSGPLGAAFNKFNSYRNGPMDIIAMATERELGITRELAQIREIDREFVTNPKFSVFVPGVNPLNTVNQDVTGTVTNIIGLGAKTGVVVVGPAIDLDRLGIGLPSPATIGVFTSSPLTPGGIISIAPERVREEAKRQGISVSEMLRRVVVHELVHSGLHVLRQAVFSREGIEADGAVANYLNTDEGLKAFDVVSGLYKPPTSLPHLDSKLPGVHQPSFNTVTENWTETIAYAAMTPEGSITTIMANGKVPEAIARVVSADLNASIGDYTSSANGLANIVAADY